MIQYEINDVEFGKPIKTPPPDDRAIGGGSDTIFHPDGNYLFLVTSSSPYIHAWEWNNTPFY